MNTNEFCFPTSIHVRAPSFDEDNHCCCLDDDPLSLTLSRSSRTAIKAVTPLGAPQPPLRAPGHVAEEEGGCCTDDTISSHSKSRKDKSKSNRSSSGSCSLQSSRSLQTSISIRSITNHYNHCHIRRVDTCPNYSDAATTSTSIRSTSKSRTESNSNSNSSTLLYSQCTNSNSSNSSSSRRSRRRHSRRTSRCSMNSDGRVQRNNNQDDGAMPLRQSVHNRSRTSSLTISGSQALDLPYASVRLVVEDIDEVPLFEPSSATTRASRSPSPAILRTRSIQVNDDEENENDPEEGETVTDQSTRADMVVAAAIDKAQLEAELEANMKTRIVTATKVRPSEIINERTLVHATGSSSEEEHGDGLPAGRTNRRKIRWMVCLVVITLVVVIVLTTILLLIVFPFGQEPTNHSPTQWWAFPPDYYDETVVDSNTTTHESFWNSSAPEEIAKQEYLREMAYQISGSTAENVNTPQYEALDWMLGDSFTIHGGIDNEKDPFQRLAERYALAVLYYSTSGDDWEESMGFLNETSVCEWVVSLNSQQKNGVLCNDGQDVLGVRLPHNHLVGTLPSELRVLEQLESLEFSSNTGLSGNIPSQLGSLAYTTALRFAGCNLTGTLPETFRDLSDLLTFSVYQNSLEGSIPPRVLEAWSRLQDADFGSNAFTGTIPDVFEPQWLLQNLYLDDNAFTGTIPRSLYASPNLQVLDLSSNSLGGTIAPQVSGLVDLRRLVLDKNRLTSTIPVQLKELLDLEFFSASHNRLTGSLPKGTSDLKKLTHLDLSFNDLSHDDRERDTVRELSSLEYLNIESNPGYGIRLSLAKASDFQLVSLVDARLRNTSVYGLNQTFCEDRDFLDNNLGKGIRIQADCLTKIANGTLVVECPCCTSCCLPGGVDCRANSDAICSSQELEFRHFWNKRVPSSDFRTTCTCKTDTTTGLEHSVCNEGDSASNTTATPDTKHYACINDGSDVKGLVCAANTDYGYAFDDTTGEEVAFQNTIVYRDDSSRWNETTILFRSYAREKGPYCEVSVNGKECQECLPTVCDGRDESEKTTVGFRIACGGTIGGDDDSPLYSFDSCSDTPDHSQSKNGYLEIFHAAAMVRCYDTQSCATTGQLPILVDFLQKGPTRLHA